MYEEDPKRLFQMKLWYAQWIFFQIPHFVKQKTGNVQPLDGQLCQLIQ